MKSLCLWVLLCAFLHTSAQCENKILESDVPDSRGHAIAKCADGGSILASVLINGPYGNYDWLISRRNTQEEILWSKAIGTNLYETGTNLVVAEMPDGYIIGGYQMNTLSSPRAFHVVKLDLSGEIIWQKKLANPISDGDTPRDILITPSRIYIAGTSRTYGPGLSDGIILCLDYNGNQLWCKAMGGSSNDHFYSIVNHSEGKIILAGNNRSYDATVHHNWIMVMDSLGNTLQETIIYSDEIDTVFRIKKNSQNNFVLTGYTEGFGSNQQATQVIELNQELQIVNQFIIDTSFDDWGFDVVTEDGFSYVLSNSWISQNIETIHFYNLDQVVNNEVNTHYFASNSSISAEGVSMGMIYRFNHAYVFGTVEGLNGGVSGMLKFSLDDCNTDGNSCLAETFTPITMVSFDVDPLYVSTKIDIDVLIDANLNSQDFTENFVLNCNQIECTGSLELEANTLCVNTEASFSVVTNNIDTENIDAIYWNIDGQLMQGTEVSFVVENQSNLNISIEVSSLNGFCVYELDSLLTVDQAEELNHFIDYDPCEGLEVLDAQTQPCVFDFQQNILSDTTLECQVGCTTHVFDVSIINPWVTIPLEIDTVICTGNVFEFDLSNIDNSLYFLPDMNTSVTIDSPGVTSLVISNGNCEQSLIITLAMDTIPFIPLTDIVICEVPYQLILEEEFTLYYNNIQQDLNLINQAGEYTAIFENNCGQSASVFDVSVLPALELWLDDLNLCNNESGELELISNQPVEILWDSGETTTAINVEVAGTYCVLATGECENLETCADVIYNQSPTISFNELNLEALCPGIIQILEADAAGTNVIWNWQLLCDDEIIELENNENSIELSSDLAGVNCEDGFTIILQASNDCGMDEASVEVGLIPCELYFPNVITPDEYAVNNYFAIGGLENYYPFGNTKLEIYNRWGALIFESDNYRNNWGGEGAVSGTYYFIATMPNEQVVNGHLTVLKDH